MPTHASTPLLRYLRMYRSRWPMVALCVFLALLVSALVMPVPLIFGHLVDHSIPDGNLREVMWLGVLAVGLYVLQYGIGILQRYLTLRTTKAVIYEIRARVCTKLQELCLGYYDNANVGHLHARAMLDTEQVDVSSNAIVTQVLVSGVSFLIAVTVLLHKNVFLTLVLLGIAPLSFIVTKLLRKRMVENHRAFRDRRESLSAGIHGMLNSIRLIKSFGMEPLEEAKMNQEIKDYLTVGTRMSTISSLFGNLIVTMGNLCVVVVWGVGAVLVMRGDMSLGDVVAFAGFQGFLLGPINQLAGISETLFSGHTALKSVFELLDEEAVEVLERGEPVEGVRGEVAFRNASFEYPDGTRALDNVAFTVEPGKQVALVGESGAGKSTLIHLVLGLYLPSAGCVCIDGRDITELNLQGLRRQMGIVSQETILLDGTIRENIRYGTPHASDEEVEEAARAAYAHGFIAKLPQGYDSPIGDDGVRLSGGQRQRIAIARAILRNPRILILDEATSALDSESELHIQLALEQLRRNRTTFVIAHRLSTVLESDTILVLKKGCVIEQGTHHDLLAKGGEYAHLYATQFHRGQEAMRDRVEMSGQLSPAEGV